MIERDPGTDDIRVICLNFDSGRPNPIVLFGRPSEAREVWNAFLGSISRSHQMYQHQIGLEGTSDILGFERAASILPYRVLSDPLIAGKGLIFVMNVSISDFQAGSGVAVFIDGRRLRPIIESRLSVKIKKDIVDRLLFPGGVISVLRERLPLSIIDTHSFFNDPLSYQILSSLVSISLLNEKKRIYFLHIVANIDLASNGGLEAIITVMEKMKVSSRGRT